MLRHLSVTLCTRTITIVLATFTDSIHAICVPHGDCAALPISIVCDYKPMGFILFLCGHPFFGIINIWVRYIPGSRTAHNWQLHLIRIYVSPVTAQRGGLLGRGRFREDPRVNRRLVLRWMLTSLRRATSVLVITVAFVYFNPLVCQTSHNTERTSIRILWLDGRTVSVNEILMRFCDAAVFYGEKRLSKRQVQGQPRGQNFQWIFPVKTYTQQSKISEFWKKVIIFYHQCTFSYILEND